MAAPYSSQTITGYNSNPPADDGSQVEANRVKWSTIKTKLNDPIKERTDSIDTALVASFAKVVGGGGVTSTAISYTVLSADQGKLIRASASGVTITTPSATDVTSPFVFGIINDSPGDITLDGSGSQTVNGDATVTLGPDEGGLVWTDGSNWFVIGLTKRTVVTPQGYLTLVPAATDAINVFPTSDQSAATAVYYRPDCGNLLPIPNGTLFNTREFSELTLTLVAAHAAGSILDVFAFDDSGTIRIGTGPAWTTATAGSGARGTGAGTTELTKLKGLPVNANAITARNGSSTYSVSAQCGLYLGSLQMDGTNGQITCHVTAGQSRKWGVWNAFNKRRLVLRVLDSTGSWTPSTSLGRSNAASANTLDVFAGLAETQFNIEFAQAVLVQSSAAGNNPHATIGIGVNSTSAYSGKAGVARRTYGNLGSVTADEYNDLVARHVIAPAIGVQNVNALEQRVLTGAGVTAFGGAASMLLKAEYFG